VKKDFFVDTIRFAVLVFIFVLSGQNVLAARGLTKIADNVYSYVDIKKMSPQNSFGANAGIVIGRDGILVIDTLISAKEAKRFIKDIRAVSDKPIKYVVNTHYHLDHTFGNAEFEKLGAIIISHTIDKVSLQNKGEGALKNAGMFGLTEQDMEGTKIAVPTITFAGTMEIDLGDRRVELLHKWASHTEGSILVYIPDKKILFTGDILFTDYHPYMADGDIKGWSSTLDDMMKMDVDTIIPGHGPISGKKDIADMKEYIIAFDKKAVELCAKSTDVDHIVSEIRKSLPPRAEGDMLIKANIQGRYLKKPPTAY
jgi:glyoxylase-like metal-dependent hydrolase (beta-lactamase superfamily II)